MPLIPVRDRTVCRNLLQDGQTFATTMVAIVLNEYGADAFTWDPETLRMEIADDFQVKMSTPNFDRLMAGVALMTGNDFYQSLPDFINICNILSGSSYDPETWDPADSTEIAWGITEALLLSPPDEDEENPFAEEIVAYIGKQLDAEGIINPPGVLQIALRDTDPNMTIGKEYSDDPVMYATIYEFEAEKTGDIDNTVRARTEALLSQLELLPFNTATKDQLLAGLSR